ncbi:hypothetical protein M5K25_013606 [Dendrobium thyrsiflorum]|uniref:Uncharacterized protein n=1 Tax=Dendrobium thyrsiflorum TaxID=117978 RepID=A0ABD0V0A0_DENTH
MSNSKPNLPSKNFPRNTMEVSFSSMENRFGGVEEMIRKLIEMKSKTPLMVLIANPNPELTRIPLAKSKRKEIEQKGFDEESFFYKEPLPRAPIRRGIGVPNGGTAGRGFYGGGGGDTSPRHQKLKFQSPQMILNKVGREEVESCRAIQLRNEKAKRKLPIRRRMMGNKLTGSSSRGTGRLSKEWICVLWMEDRPDFLVSHRVSRMPSKDSSDVAGGHGKGQD